VRVMIRGQFTYPQCVCCGTNTAELASVLDPWLDASYGVCVECIAPLHNAYMNQLQITIEEEVKSIER
jgi:hypothetical protein